MSASLQRKWLAAGAVAIFVALIQGFIFWRTQPPPPPAQISVLPPGH